MTTATGIIPLQGCRCRRPLHVDKRVFDMNGLAGWWWWFSEKWCSEMIVLLLKWGGDIARIHPGCSVWVCRSSTSTFTFGSTQMAVASLLISCNEHHDIAAAHTTAEIPVIYFVSRVPPPHVETTLLLSIPFLCGHSWEPRFSLKAWEEGGGQITVNILCMLPLTARRSQRMGLIRSAKIWWESSRYIKIVTKWKCKDPVSQNKRKKNLSFYVFTDVELAVNHESNLSRVASVLLPTYTDWLISLQEPRC